MTRIRLGLIGDNIRASRSPDLHRFCGQLSGLDVSYDLLLPPELQQSFDQVFDRVRAEGLRGVNITLPYKEQVVGRVRVDDPQIARIGSVNTVRFDPDGPRGFNTDYSGFVSAYRTAFRRARPGRVALIGAGGVGKAIAFGLISLGATEIIFIDTDRANATALAKSVAEASDGRTATRVGDITVLGAVDGVINCTPLGMVGYPGSPVPDGAFPKNGWAFDAVYTPLDTPFRAQARAAGATFLPGYELFFKQGIDAFEIFTGQRPANLERLRFMLQPAGDPRLSDPARQK